MRRYLWTIILSSVIVAATCVTFAMHKVDEYKKASAQPHFRVQVVSPENDSIECVNISYRDAANGLAASNAATEYMSAFPLSAYDAESEELYYAGTVENKGKVRTQLFVSSGADDQPIQLTDNLTDITYLYRSGSFIYMLVSAEGRKTSSPAAYDIQSQQLYLYGTEDELWDFDLMTFDVYSGRVFAAACVAEDKQAAQNEAERTGQRYIAPNYVLFSFGEGLSSPVQTLRTDRKLIRRMSAGQDGNLFITLADSKPDQSPNCESYIYDVVTGSLNPSVQIDSLMDSVSECVFYDSFGECVYFTGTQDNVKGLYSCELDTDSPRLVYDSEDGVDIGFLMYN